MDPAKRAEADLIEGAAWRAPPEFIDATSRIVARFNGSGAITIPNGIVEPADCAGFNARTFEDGRILICRDVYLEAQSEDEIAFVIGHELGHLVRNHHKADNLPGGILTAGALATLGVALLLHDPTGATGGYQLLSMFTTFQGSRAAATSYISTFRMPEELEADRIGADLLAAARYDTATAFGVVSALPSSDYRPKTGAEILDWAPHPDRVKRTEEMRKYLKNNDYQEVTPTDLPWVAGSPSSEITNYRTGLRLASAAEALATSIYMLRLKTHDANADLISSNERQLAGRDANILCSEAMLDLRNARATPLRLDRSFNQSAVAIFFQCDPAQGFQWLLDFARSERAGLRDVSDLVAYTLYAYQDDRMPVVEQHWREHVVPRAATGAGYKYAEGFALNYMHKPLYQSLYDACIAANEVNCRVDRSARNQGGLRTILNYVEAPATETIYSLERVAVDYLNGKVDLHPAAKRVLKERRG